MIKLIIDNKVIDTGRIVFSDGAVGFDLKDLPETANRILFSVDPCTKVNTVLDELMQLNAAIPDQIYHHVRQELFIPYLPYGRADRKFSPNGNFGLCNFALCLLGQITFDKVTVVDPHNPSTTLSCFSDWFGCGELEIISQRQALMSALNEFHVDISEYDAIVAPDKGAKDKAQEIADYYELPLIVCTKERDPSTGKLSNPVVNGDVAGKKLLIVDDIFDAGGTFIQLATELQKQVPAKIDLYVTHLIGAKGLDILRGKIDNVFCYHTVAGYLTMQDVINFNKGE